MSLQWLCDRLPEFGTGSRYGRCDGLGQKDVLGFETITKAGLRKSRFAHEFNEAQIVDAALPGQPRRSSDDGALVSCHLPLRNARNIALVTGASTKFA